MSRDHLHHVSRFPGHQNALVSQIGQIYPGENIKKARPHQEANWDTWITEKKILGTD